MTPTSRSLALLTALLLAACASTPSAGLPRVAAHTEVASKPDVPAATSKPTLTAASAKPLPPTPATSPAASPTATPALQRLVLPTAGTLLHGTVTIDAAYAIATGAGQPFGTGADEVVDVAPANLISDAGGNLISDAGGNLITEHGGGLISDAGGNLVSNNGSNLIGNNGGGLTSKTKFALEAVDSPSALTPGAALPAAGMVVGLVSLLTHTPLPLGQDAAGNPIYAVYTDGRGAYALPVPAAEAGNVLVVAYVPASTDARLSYDLVTATTGGTATLDEASALTTKFLRLVFAQRFAAYMRYTGTPGSPIATDPIGLALEQFLSSFLTQLVTAAQAIHFASLPADQQAALAQRLSDRLFATIDLPKVQTDQTISAWPGPPEPALPVIETILAQTAAAAAPQLAADPHAFDALGTKLAGEYALIQPQLPVVAQAPFPTFEIRKPIDLADWLVRGPLATGNPLVTPLAAEVFGAAGLSQPNDVLDHLLAAGNGVMLALAPQLLDPTIQAALFAEIGQAASP